MPAAVEAARGWRPLADDAVIAIRSWLVFTAHSPTVGEYSSSSTGGRVVHDLGPVAFWLLSLPVRIDPSTGLLWGAAICCGLVLSVAVEASWRTGVPWVAGGLVALIGVVLWHFPDTFADLPWNPFFGLCFLLATIALALVVGRGRLGWWPVLVLSGSVAAQSHLFYAVPAGLMVLGAPVLGLAVGGRPSRWRWLVGGAVAAVACWAVPLAQQAFGNPGNLSLVVGRSAGSTAGAGLGLRQVATAAAPLPLWLTGRPTSLQTDAHFVSSGSEVYGALVVLALVVGTAAGLARKKRTFPPVTGIAGLFSLGVAVSYSHLPTSHEANYLSYLAEVSWVLSVVLWATLAVLVVRAGRALGSEGLGALRSLAPGGTSARSIRRVTGAVGLLATVGLGAALYGAASSQPAQVPVARVTADARAANAVGRLVRRGPVIVRVAPTSAVNQLGLAWLLVASGRRIALGPNYDPASCGGHPPAAVRADCIFAVPPRYGAITTGLTPPSGARWPVVEVDGGGAAPLTVRRVTG